MNRDVSVIGKGPTDIEDVWTSNIEEIPAERSDLLTSCSFENIDELCCDGFMVSIEGSESKQSVLTSSTSTHEHSRADRAVQIRITGGILQRESASCIC